MSEHRSAAEERSASEHSEHRSAAEERSASEHSEHRSAAEERSAGQHSASPRIHITQVKSTIGSKPVHRKTMKALGLAGIGRSTSLPDTRDVRGMLAKVNHLVTVEAAPSEESA